MEITNWTIEKEERQITTTKGNTYTQVRFVVYHDKGFNAFTSIDEAETFVNSL